MNTKIYITMLLSLICGMATLASAAIVNIAPTTTQYTTDFEDFSVGYTQPQANSVPLIGGFDGWRGDGLTGLGGQEDYDAEILDVSGNQVFRISNPNSAATGNYDTTHPATPAIGKVGESGSGGLPGTFTVSFEFRAASASLQDGLQIDVTPFESGTASRQSIIRITDDSTDGFSVGVWETDAAGEFFFVPLATGLSRTDWHSITMSLEIKDGPDNDVVTVDLTDGSDSSVTSETLRTWEGYYANVGGVQPSVAAVDSVIFRLSTGGGPDGGGVYFDNMVTSANTFDVQGTIDGSNPGDTIVFPAGDFSGPTYSIPHELTLQGANQGVAGTDTRAAETKVSAFVINPSVANVTIDGFCFDDGNEILGERAAVYLNNNSGPVTVTNNRFLGAFDPENSAETRIIAVVTSSAGTGELTVTDNYFTTYETAVYVNPNSTGAMLDGNTVEDTRYAFRFISTPGVSITDNTITGSGGIHFREGWSSPFDPVTVTAFSGNSFSIPEALEWVGYLGIYSEGLEIELTGNTYEGNEPADMTALELLAFLNLVYDEGNQFPTSGSIVQGGYGKATLAGFFTATPVATTGGTISPDVSTIVFSGEDITFTFTPDPLNVLDSVEVSTNGTDFVEVPGATSPETFTVTSDIWVRANYGIGAATIETLVSGGIGSISPTGPVTVPTGANQTFTLTPASGFSIDTATFNGNDITGDLVGAGNTKTYTATSVSGSNDLEVTFAGQPVTITASATGSLGRFFTVSAPTSASAGDTITVTVTALNGVIAGLAQGTAVTINGVPFTIPGDGVLTSGESFDVTVTSNTSILITIDRI